MIISIVKQYRRDDVENCLFFIITLIIITNYRVLSTNIFNQSLNHRLKNLIIIIYVCLLLQYKINYLEICYTSGDWRAE